MPEPQPRLYLISPFLGGAEPFAAPLREACRAADVAAVLLRLAPADERTLVNLVKALAPVAQDAGVAVLVEIAGEIDPALVASRGGADGVHAARPAELTPLRARLRDGRMLGAGGLRDKHSAMSAGEAGVDYVMFGEPRPDGYVPPFEQTLERAGWWADIFETPCVAYAPSLEIVAELAGTGAEFLALGEAVWSHPAGAADAVRLASLAISDRASEPVR